MTDEPHNLILDHLRQLRASIDALHDDVKEIKERQSANDLRLASLSRDISGLAESDARIQIRIDRLADTITRLNRRFETADTVLSSPLV